MGSVHLAQPPALAGRKDFIRLGPSLVTGGERHASDAVKFSPPGLDRSWITTHPEVGRWGGAGLINPGKRRSRPKR
jgi:hypothetical protein